MPRVTMTEEEAKTLLPLLEKLRHEEELRQAFNAGVNSMKEAVYEDTQLALNETDQDYLHDLAKSLLK